MTQPQNASVIVGQTATFSVTANGTQPLSYQWQKNQANIAGATSANYTTPATVAGDNGTTFRVIVSNGMQPNATSNSATLTVSTSASSAVNVLTYHNDNARTGQNLNETILTTSNVNSATFGKLATLPVNGNVDAEPLYVSQLAIAGGTHNVLYIVTEKDMVYAFDADTFAQLWSVSVANGESPPGLLDGCDSLNPSIGVTATPVIDRTAGPSGTIFVVAMTQDSSGNYHQRLHALDLTSGAERAGGPVAITGAYTVNGVTSNFDPEQYVERVGLLLTGGNIYVAWSSHCDSDPYQGWIMGFSESALQRTKVLNVTPLNVNVDGNSPTSRGAIWMSDTAMAADSSNNIYFLDGNGIFGDNTASPPTSGGFPTTPNYGNAFMKLSTSGASLTVADYFATFNTKVASDGDTDFGSGGVILLPDMTDSNGVVRHLAVGAGKDGYIYVVNRDSMGKFNSSNDTAVYQKLNDPSGDGSGTPVLQSVFSMPAFFNNTVYYGASEDNLKAFPIANAKLAAAPSAQSAASIGYPGCTPSISANGAANGIVWCLRATSSGGTLSAYSASNLSLLYESPQFADTRDVKFVTPMIANGKVYAGAQNGVVVFGLLGP